MFVLPFLFISLFCFALWCLLFLFSKKTRKEQLLMSLFGFVLAPGMILLVLLTDFRQTASLTSGTVGIEDILFAFSICGIAAVIYEIFLGRHVHLLKPQKGKFHSTGAHWLAHLIILLGLWMCVTLLLLLLFPINSVYAFIVGGLLIGIYIIADRHDLLLNALLSGLFLVVILFFLEQVFFIRLFPDAAILFWKQTDSISGFYVYGIPLEELLWAATVGFTLGPLYEYVRKWKLK